jgi:hypothetical protein
MRALRSAGLMPEQIVYANELLMRCSESPLVLVERSVAFRL